MYYKLYIDSLFVSQLIINLYIIALTGKVLKCTATHLRIIIGAIVGAGLTCLVCLIPIGTVYVRLLFGAIPVNMCMMRVSFRVKMRQLFQSGLFAAGSEFFIGGIISWVQNRFWRHENREVGMLTLSLIGLLAYSVGNWLVKRVHLRRQERCFTVKVPLDDGKQMVLFRAFLDTGNHLYDPLCKKPVCLLQKESSKSLVSLFLPEKFHVIPFCSVGKEKGYLQAYEIPQMIIEEEYQERIVKNVILAICDTGLEKESPYQMILHPQLIEN